MKKLFLTALIAFLLGLGVFWLTMRPAPDSSEASATILLEQVRKVTKLVTIEGDVSEIYNTTKTRKVTLYLPLPATLGFDKKASVQVEGTVLVGYNLEQLRIDVDEVTRTITIGNLPEPEILAIDHELTYRNLEESWFNTFSAEDYSALNREAKARLRDEALKSRLMDEARERGNGVIETIGFLAEAAGFQLVVEQREMPQPEG
jgi:hypothetical protein